MPTLDFWYEFASTYSYPAALRIEAAADKAGVTVRFRPFLLGPIFAAQGWTTSPFNLYPAKGRYMWRDLERICHSLGLAFRQPAPFPQASLTAARVALALDELARPAFSKAIYVAEFGDGRDISKPETIASVLGGLGQDAGAVLARAAAQPVRDALRAETKEARRIGIFGAPSFVTRDGEPFWGNDRLDQALEWARRAGGCGTL